MNLLTDSLPQAIVVRGREYPVHTDFRNWIRFERAVLDEELPQAEKLVLLLTLCYKTAVPPTVFEAINEAVLFYAGGESDTGQQSKKGRGIGREPIYSFEHDADYIYSAFLSQYGIDLQTADLHWYQFKALFKSLNEENQIVKIMGYRSVDLSRIKNKEQREFYRRMKKLYELPHSKKEVEKLNQIEQALLSGGDLSGVL
jgi:hypothetical protein